jgi:hypothetical protein
MTVNRPSTKVGRPRIGRVKLTLKIAPKVLAALDLAMKMTGRNKSDLVEEAVIAYLHLDSDGEKSSGR